MEPLSSYKQLNSSPSLSGLSLNELDIAIFTRNLHAEGLLMENISAKMSPVARQASTDKFGGQKPEEKPGIALEAPQHAQQVDLFISGLHSPHHSK